MFQCECRGPEMQCGSVEAAAQNTKLCALHQACVDVATRPLRERISTLIATTRAAGGGARCVVCGVPDGTKDRTFHFFIAGGRARPICSACYDLVSIEPPRSTRDAFDRLVALRTMLALEAVGVIESASIDATPRLTGG